MAASSLPEPPDPADERPHASGPGRDWEESWYFDFVADDGGLVGFARIGLRPAAGRAWWWTAVAGVDRALVAVRDHDVDLPRGASLEIRASGLWAEPVCETPFEHWSLGLEAVAVALDDPADAYAGERGEPVPLGFDLEWEDTSPPARWPEGGRYGLACEVHGEVLIGRERLAIAGFGSREHAWGRRDWWGEGWTGAAGRLEDGTAVGPRPSLEASVDLDQRGLVAGGRVMADGGSSVALEPVFQAPVQIPGGPSGQVSRLARAACRMASDDGRRGWAWVERLQPA